VKAGKAYISSLGTTGLLIASSVLMLLVVGTIVGFHRWPSGSPGGVDTVAIGGADHLRPARSLVAEQRRLRADRRQAAARRRAARVSARLRTARAGAAGDETTIVDPVVSGLPAPEAGPAPGAVMGSPTGRGDVGARSGGGVRDGGHGGETAGQVGGAVSQVSPQAGDTLGQLGQAVDQAVTESAPQVAP
jgi:hypothetical protein